MRTNWSFVVSSALAVSLVSGSGCAGRGLWKDKWEVPAMSAPTPGGPMMKSDSGVVQASGSSPFAQLPASLSWMTGKSDKAKSGAGPADIAVAWRKHIDYLPDPLRQGAMNPGLAGQIFLFNSHDQPAIADGTITVDLFDETPRPAGQQPNKPERWQFKKDVLKTLRAVDERFGPNYVLFLPWLTFRPDVTHVRITVRYDPEQGGFPLYAQESKLVLDGSKLGAGAFAGARAPGAPPGVLIPAGGTAGAQPFGAASPGAPSGSNSGPGMGVIRMTGPPKQNDSPAIGAISTDPASPPALGIISPGPRP